MSAPARPCPRCGTPHAPEQEYCLECGLRLPADGGRFAAWSTRMRERYAWFPGEWVWPALLALVVAVAGGALAIAASAENGDKPAFEVATGGSVQPTAPEQTLPTAPEPTVPATTTTAPQTTTEPPPTTTAPPPGPRVIAWPRGKEGWTNVLVSIPQSAGLETARARAREAAGRLPQVGVLDSSNFASLHPGYYVVFSGVYDSQAEATSALTQARAAFRAAYARQIVR